MVGVGSMGARRQRRKTQNASFPPSPHTPKAPHHFTGAGTTGTTGVAIDGVAVAGAPMRFTSSR
jgi:hypothetical protein